MTVESDLERRIAGAFSERARSLPSGAGLAPMSPIGEPPATRPTRVLVLALVTLLVISGAGVLVAVRRSGDGKGSVEGAGSGTVRFRSTAIVSVFPPRSNDSAWSAAMPNPAVPDSVKLAMAPGVRKTAVNKAGAAPERARIAFAASINSVGSRLSLVVTAPSGSLATLVIRNWESLIATGRRAIVRAEVIRSAPAARLRYLAGAIATIDTDLARLDPANYRDALQYDEGPSAPGRSSSAPPPVPERGTPHELNLAFERIQLLSAREKAETAEAKLLNEAKRVVTDWVSLTPPTRVAAAK